MPLVTEPIGTSSSGTPGYTQRHIRRETTPCSWATRIGGRREIQRQHRHGEQFVIAHVLAAQVEKFVARQTQALVVIGEMFVNQVEAKAFQPGGHRGMGGEDIAGAGQISLA